MAKQRTEVLQFTVTPDERRLIEKCAKKEDMTVSEYVRVSLLMEMIIRGEVEAMKIVLHTIGEKTAQLLRKRLGLLSAFNKELA